MDFLEADQTFERKGFDGCLGKLRTDQNEREIQIDGGAGQTDEIFVGVNAADVKKKPFRQAILFFDCFCEQGSGFLEIDRIGGEGSDKNFIGIKMEKSD